VRVPWLFIIAYLSHVGFCIEDPISEWSQEAHNFYGFYKMIPGLLVLRGLLVLFTLMLPVLIRNQRIKNRLYSHVGTICTAILWRKSRYNYTRPSI
jgi:hypothetical protein